MHYLSTPDGPMVADAGPALLRSLIPELEALVQRMTGLSLADEFYPGSDRQDIESALRSRGLVPNEELYVWFGWQDGPRPGRANLFPHAYGSSLNEAVARYDERIAYRELPHVRALREAVGNDDAIDVGAGPRWIRLDAEAWGCAVECAQDVEVPRIRFFSASWPEDTTGLAYRARSLSTRLAWWVDGLRDGAYTWSAAEQQWKNNQDGIPESQRAAFFQ